MEVSKSITWRKTDLIEIKLKIRDNYIGIIPTQVTFNDAKDNIFTVQTISYSEGRWFKEKMLVV